MRELGAAAGREAYEQSRNDEVIDINPHGAAPVVLISAVRRVVAAEAADTVLAPQLLLVGDEVEDGGQPPRVVVGAKQPEQEGEEGDVAVVADERVSAILDGGVAVGLAFLRPVQGVDVLLHAVAVGSEGAGVGGGVGAANVLGDGVQGAGHGADPAESVEVEFARVGRLRARVVVEAAGQDVVGGAAFPAVGFLRGGVGPGVGRQVAGLGLAEPGVVALEQRVKLFEELLGLGRMGEVERGGA